MAPTWTHSFCYQIEFSQIQFEPREPTNFSTKSPVSHRITREVSTGKKGDARNSKALSFIRWRLIIDTVLGLLLTSKKCCHVVLAKQQMPKKRKSKDAKHFALCRPDKKWRKIQKKKYIYIYIYTIEGSTKICWDAGNLGLCRPSWWPFCLTVISNNFIFPSLSRDCVADCNATRRHRGKFPMLSRLFNNVFQYRIIYLSYAILFYRNENVVLNRNQEEKQ